MRRADGASLEGLRIVVPRGGAWGERVARDIAERGGSPVVIPLIDIVPVERSALAPSVADWNAREFDWLVVTSANTVPVIVDAGATARASARVAAVGPHTAEALEEHGFAVDLVPRDDYSAEGLADALLPELGESAARILLPVSALAESRLETRLRGAGHSVTRVAAYRPEPVPVAASARESLRAGGADVVLVTSGSAARALAAEARYIPATTRFAAIGHATARACEAAGLTPAIVSTEHTVGGLLDAIARARDDRPHDLPHDRSHDAHGPEAPATRPEGETS